MLALLKLVAEGSGNTVHDLIIAQISVIISQKRFAKNHSDWLGEQPFGSFGHAFISSDDSHWDQGNFGPSCDGQETGL